VTKVLLSLHVLAALVAIGPVAVAASMFPAVARRAFAGGGEDVGNLQTLYRICRVYALVGIAIPVSGFATAGIMHVTGNAWVLVSIGLTALAAVILAVLILPRQQRVLTTRDVAASARLAMYTGLFNLLWAAVTVLMIVRPGSTTSA